MDRGQPLLDIIDARPAMPPGAVIHAQLALSLQPADFTLIECDDAGFVRDFADLCCGLAPLEQGEVRFCGQDWTELPEMQTAALRGRIGRVFGGDSWISFLDMESNILLSQSHHTRRELDDLRSKAAELAYDFGLPGLPVGAPSALTRSDLARAACVRAFLGDPLLLLLENPMHGEDVDLTAPLLNAVLNARGHGAAIVWFTSDEAFWRNASVPATIRLRLSERGLVRPRRFT